MYACAGADLGPLWSWPALTRAPLCGSPTNLAPCVCTSTHTHTCALAEVSRLGVTSIYTPKGMTPGVWQEGLRAFAAAAATHAGKQQQQHGRKGGKPASKKAGGSGGLASSPVY